MLIKWKEELYIIRKLFQIFSPFYLCNSIHIHSVLLEENAHWKECNVKLRIMDAIFLKT